MTKKPPSYEMPALSEQVVGPVKTESIRLADQAFKLARPESPDRLLDLGEVAAAYRQDEYMPYWATLWPVAKYLATEVLKSEWPQGCKGIELGCGLGLPGLAALAKGVDMTFTDYDATALRFVDENAKLNGFTGYRTLVLDWRQPLAERFDLILASDLTYERRNLEPLIASFLAMLAPHGTILLADQNRPYAAEFCAQLKAAGFTYQTYAMEADVARGLDVTGTVYRIRHVNVGNV